MPRKHKPLMKNVDAEAVAVSKVTFSVPQPIAYQESCVSPSGIRCIKHRTDIGMDREAARERSNAFVEKYKRQGWRVSVTALYV